MDRKEKVPQNSKAEKKEKLAGEILRLSRNTLLVSCRFLDMALSMFEYVPGKGGIAVDGEHIYYDPDWVLEQYRAERTVIARDYLHMVLHCIFHHSFLNKDVNPVLWSLACDAAVENAIDGLDLRITWAKRSMRQLPFLIELKKNLKSLTAEKIYLYLLKQEMTDVEAALIRRDFMADEHDIWFLRQEAVPAAETSDREGAGREPAEQEAQTRQEGEKEESPEEGGSRTESENERAWKEIAQRVQTELETFGKEQGDQAGSLIQNLKAVTRERYDYGDFLRKFAHLSETLRINDDEFDYIFYTYGMKLYRKMPLIEPLEYREEKRIREFVIAIDTSASVSGDLVQKFVQKTFNILKQQESFFSKINLHLIQCDTVIQEDVCIRSREEFDDYLPRMQLKGFGGTDFRPVFEYIETLRKEGETGKPDGLIYFTDGYGTFPERQPDYPAAFVFIDDEYNNPEVPVWAIRLILPADEI